MSGAPTPGVGTRELLATAIGLHEAGQLARAEHVYREVLRVDPRNADALNLLGVIACQNGRAQAGVDLLRRASASAPRDADIANNLGQALTEAGEPQTALAEFARAQGLRPRFAEAHFNAGNAAIKLGDDVRAEREWRAAIDARPAYVDALRNLSTLLARRNDTRTRLKVLRQLAQALPRDAAAQFDLARACAALRLHEDAVDAFRRGLALEPGQARMWEACAANLRASGHLSAASMLLEQALGQCSDDAALWDALAMSQFALGLLDEARTSLTQARACGANSATLAVHAGLIESATGRRQAALACYRQALALEPGNADALRGLVELGIDDDDLLSEILSALAAAARDSPARATLEFARGRLLDRRGDYASAFAAFAQANTLRRQRTAFDASTQTQFIAALVGEFDREFFSRCSAIADPSVRPLFILGMPRSGTTLVEQMLAMHPAVHGAGELTFFAEQALALGRRSGGFPHRIRRRVRDLAGLAPAYLEVLARHHSSARYVSDKMPYNFLYLGLIAAIFPRAHVVHCRRHPLATCWSLYTHDLAGSHPYSHVAEELASAYAGYRRLIDHWRATLEVPWLDVDHEELVSDPQAVMGRLHAFLELEPDSGWQGFHASTRIVTTASQWQVRQPLDRASSAHWQRYAPYIEPLRQALLAAAVPLPPDPDAG